MRNLDLGGNIISSTENCEELKLLPSLGCLDLKNNMIDDKDNLVPFISQLTTLKALYMKGNPCLRHISQYRKRLTEALKDLYYLDDRPIAEFERLLADARVRGGAEEEEKVREEYKSRVINTNKNFMKMAKEKVEEGKTRRKKVFKMMMEELKQDRAEMIKKRDSL